MPRWRQWTKDHDDHISPAELQAFLGREEDGAESATYRLSVVDQNGDGELSDEELRRGLGIRFTSARQQHGWQC